MFLWLLPALLGISAVFAMLGLGGGMLYIPILHWTGYSWRETALPLGLLLNGLANLVALVNYGREHLVDWRRSLPAGLTALVAAPLGAYVSRRLSAGTLVLGFSALVVLAALRSLFTRDTENSPRDWSAWRRLLVVLAGTAGAAFLGGMVGVTGGFLMIPVLGLAGYSARETAANTSLLVSFSSLAGFLGHLSVGARLPWTVVWPMALVILVGATIGSRLTARRAGYRTIKIVYGLVLLGIAGVLMGWRIWLITAVPAVVLGEVLRLWVRSGNAPV